MDGFTDEIILLIDEHIHGKIFHINFALSCKKVYFALKKAGMIQNYQLKNDKINKWGYLYYFWNGVIPSEFSTQYDQKMRLLLYIMFHNLLPENRPKNLFDKKKFITNIDQINNAKSAKHHICKNIMITVIEYNQIELFHSKQLQRIMVFLNHFSSESNRYESLQDIISYCCLCRNFYFLRKLFVRFSEKEQQLKFLQVCFEQGFYQGFKYVYQKLIKSNTFDKTDFDFGHIDKVDYGHALILLEFGKQNLKDTLVDLYVKSPSASLIKFYPQIFTNIDVLINIYRKNKCVDTAILLCNRLIEMNMIPNNFDVKELLYQNYFPIIMETIQHDLFLKFVDENIFFHWITNFTNSPPEPLELRTKILDTFPQFINKKFFTNYLSINYDDIDLDILVYLFQKYSNIVDTFTFEEIEYLMKVYTMYDFIHIIDLFVVAKYFESDDIKFEFILHLTATLPIAFYVNVMKNVMKILFHHKIELYIRFLQEKHTQIQNIKRKFILYMKQSFLNKK